MHTNEMSSNLSGHLLLVVLFAFLIAACGPSSGSGSTEETLLHTAELPAELTTPETISTTTTRPTSTSLFGAASSTTRSEAEPNVLSVFVTTWNEIALDQGRYEWVIESGLQFTPPSSPENTYGLEVELGGHPTQLVVDVVATGERLARLEVAVLRMSGSSGELMEDAFRVGVMTALSGEDQSQVDDVVAELVDGATLSPPDVTETVQLPNGAIAGSFSTDVVHVLNIGWPSE